MKKLLLSFLFSSLAPVQFANADECMDRFKELMMGQLERGAVKIHITQQMKGAPATKNWHYNNGEGHWMTEMIDPVDMPWSMAHENRFYSSADQGKTWKFVSEMDDAAAKQKAREMLEQDAATASNASCGSEELEGTTYETVSGTHVSSVMQGAEVSHKYWVNPDDGWIARLDSTTSGNGFEMTTSQVLEPASDLQLPVPK